MRMPKPTSISATTSVSCRKDDDAQHFTRQGLSERDQQGAPRRLPGGTAQVIPHITDEIKAQIKTLGRS